MDEQKKSNTLLMTKEPVGEKLKDERVTECDIPRSTIDMLEQTLQIA